METQKIYLSTEEIQAILDIAARAPKSLAEKLYIDGLVIRIQSQMQSSTMTHVTPEQ